MNTTIKSKGDKIWEYIQNNQDNEACAHHISLEFGISPKKAKDLIFDWALGNREPFKLL